MVIMMMMLVVVVMVVVEVGVCVYVVVTLKPLSSGHLTCKAPCCPLRMTSTGHMIHR